MMAPAAPKALQTKQNLTVHLQSIPLLMGVDAKALGEMAVSLQYQSIARGSYAVQKGDTGEHLLFVLTGRLQAVDLTEDGHEVGLNFLIPGDYFGELSIIDGLPRSASVVASENSLVALLPRVPALALIHLNPLVSERMFKRMAASIRSAAFYRTILGIPNAFQRVFALLNQFAKTAPSGMVVIENMPTQQEIAITVNTSRETVSRAINILLKKGVVEKDMRRLIVRQPEALRMAITQEISSTESN